MSVCNKNEDAEHDQMNGLNRIGLKVITQSAKSRQETFSNKLHLSDQCVPDGGHRNS